MKRKIDFGDVLISIVKYMVLVPFTIACIYPFYYVIISSVSDPRETIVKLPMLYPLGFSLETYVEFFKRDDLWNAIFMSVSTTALGTVGNVFCTSLLAFLMTQDMVGKKFVKKYLAMTMYLSGGLIPTYLMFKFMGFTNNYLVFIVPGLIGIYNMILIRTFIENLPESLLESAEIEGAGLFCKFFRIVLPLSKPILATVALYVAVARWNDWTTTFFYTTKPQFRTLSYILHVYLTQASSVVQNMMAGQGGETAGNITTTSVRMTAIVVATFPIMVLYPFLQKYFAKGIMIGAIKG